MANGVPTAIVVDEWPLVRLGIGQALRSMSIRVVAELGGAADAARLVAEHGAGWVLLGTFRDLAPADAVRRVLAVDRPPRVVVLLDHVSRDLLASLLSLGVDALLVRSVGPEELAGAIGRVDKGERVVAPSLLPLLVGVLGTTGDGPEGGGPGFGPDDGSLTRKELEVLTRLADGRSNKEIADALFVAPATVKTHLAHIYTKLGVAGRQEAVARAVELGLLR
ncbi:MAG TPA: response regulator transcription factor [Acidimicrobiales bacterium]|nr:response regulator transcription factor [Acidimicrobiales bacterium]